MYIIPVIVAAFFVGLAAISTIVGMTEDKSYYDINDVKQIEGICESGKLKCHVMADGSVITKKY